MQTSRFLKQDQWNFITCCAVTIIISFHCILQTQQQATVCRSTSVPSRMPTTGILSKVPDSS